MPASNSGLFKTGWFPELVARIFSLRPLEKIWEWADRDNVFLDATMAAEPGFYRSAKTPWTRRIQELCQHPFRYVYDHPTGTMRKIRVRKIAVKKSSQSGFTEAVLNAIRWFAKFSPRNVIYSIDTSEEAGNIRDRLAKTLSDETLTGDEDDMKRLKLTLRHMIVWFYGSFAPGKYANKQAPFGVVDEAAQHENGTRSVGDVESRTKTSDEGLVVVISKLEEKGDAIDKEHSQGTQDIYLVPCPFCGTYQELNLETLKFDHCRNLLGEWDLARVLREAAMQCAATGRDDAGELICGKLIPESYKEWMVGVDENNCERGHWLSTHAGDPDADPEVVSMEINDFYSLSASVSWGRLAVRIIKTKGDYEARKVLWTQSFTRAWQRDYVHTDRDTIIGLKGEYKRGTIPFPPWLQLGEEKILPLILGADVGLRYVRWCVGAISSTDDIALVDWGSELHPETIREIILTASWPLVSDPAQRFSITQGGMDAKYRKEDVYPACLRSQRRLWPTSGGATSRGKASFAFGSLPTYPPWFGLLSYADRDFKSELYIDRIPNKHLIVPKDIEQKRAGETFDFIQELCAERLEESRSGWEWTTREPGKMTRLPNHGGDTVKIICIIWRFLMRKRDPEDSAPAIGL